MKIVSLLPSATEIVFALGLGDALAAVTSECDHPPEAGEKPVVSTAALPTGPRAPRAVHDAVEEHMARRDPIYRIDRDLIRRIQPDLILAQDLCRVCAVPSGQIQEALERLGTSAAVLSLDPRDLGGILDCIVEVGRVTGTEGRARALVASLRERIEAVRAAGARLPRIRTFCLEWLDPPFAAGHWVPEMVALAAGENLLGEPGLPSRPVSWRAIAEARPEVLVHMPCGYYLEEAEAEAARISQVPEFREAAADVAAVVAVDASSYFSRPGPRIVDGLEVLAWCIHPEGFPPPPPGRAVRVGPT